MEIKSIYDIQQLITKPSSRNTFLKSANSIITAKESSGFDTIDISPNASFQVKLDAQTKRYSEISKQNSTVSQAKLSELKAKYEGDNCPLSGYDIANAILRNVCGHSR